MSKKTKYNKSWQDSFDWVSQVKEDYHAARCNICNKVFSIGSGGVSDLKQHSKTAKHTKNAALMKGQSAFRSNSFKLQGGTSKPTLLTDKEQVLNAEIIEAIHSVDSNQSFSASNGSGKRYKKMFPCEVAANFSLQETKMKYTIQFGIAPYVKDQLVQDISNKPFVFKFDETTTSQVKKQYDAYITYMSYRYQKIVTSYCGSLFVGHCTASDLKNHFHEFIRKLGLKTPYLLSLGMDGPNVNKSFAEKLSVELKSVDNTSYIDVGSCSLHACNNAFAEALKTLKETINLDQIAIDLHFFFKHSATRREDYVSVSSITDVTSQFVLKHCQSRWLSLDRVLVRIVEQFKNLKEYFLVKLPSLPGFTGKNGIRETDRYQRVRKALTDPKTKIYMSFIINLAQNFKDFILPLQSVEPKIHLLYDKSTKLISDVALRFIDKEKIFNANGKLLPKDDLLQVIKDKENHKVSFQFVFH